MKNKRIISIPALLGLVLVSAFQFTKAQTGYTFTPAGATGLSGPTQAMVNTAYVSTSLNGMVTSNIGIQSWTVPFTGLYRITAYGARGGNANTSGGNGAKMQGDFNLTSGQVLKILVGQPGVDDGGGGGAVGGGGGSFIATSANAPLIVAGGGSGSSGFTPGLGATTTSVGNTGQNCASAGTTGFGGGDALNCNSGNGGGGGFYGNGMSSSSYGSQFGYGFVNGGAGGTSSSGSRYGGFGGGCGTHYNNTGGGPGGGYTGGGASYHSSSYVGGGGSSYNSGTNQVNTPSVNFAAGFVVITKLQGVDILQTSTISCNGQLTAALSATATGGTPPYTYFWSPGGSTSQNISGLGAGIYTCQATDINALVLTATFQVTQPPLLTGVITSQSLSCYGAHNGSALISLSGGVTPYTYTWAPGGSNASGIGSLNGGTYTVNAKDANNCPLTTTVNVVEPAPLALFAFATSPVICAGQSNTLVAAGALTYTWTGGVTNGVGFFPAATAMYTVSGTNSNGCVGVGVTGVTVNPLPVVSITGNAVICVGNVASLSANGANSYSWSTGAQNTSVINVSPLSNTTYTALGTNANGCVNSSVRTVTVNALPIISSSISNSVSCSGSPVIVIASGAVTYTWTNGISNGIAFYPTANDSYTVTGTDANGCNNTSVKSITVLALPNVAVSGSSASCAGAPATLTASGASTYSWSTGATTGNISVTPTTSTVYSVTGTDANGCKNTTFYGLAPSPLPQIQLSATNTVICDGIPVTINANGASTYTWLPLNTNNALVTVAPNITTTYTVSGTSPVGCINTTVITINVNSAPLVSIAGPTITCVGIPATLTASGASSYTWSNGANTSSTSVSPASTTIYTVTALGANGCYTTVVRSIAVTPVPSVFANTTGSVICRGASTTLFASGANAYTWSPMNSSSAFISVSPIVSTTYSLTGSNAVGCSGSATVLIIVNTLPTVSISGTGSVCAGTPVSLSANGTTSYTWSTSSNNSTITDSPLTSKVYSVSGSDANGCVNTATFGVNVVQLPALTVTGSHYACMGSVLNVSATGAATYTWNNGTNGPLLSVSPVSNTVLTVIGTNTDGCSGSTTHLVFITSPPVVTINGSHNVCYGTTSVLNANGASTYSWSTGSASITTTISPLQNASYSVTGTDANGCAASASFAIIVNSLPVLSVTGTDSICKGNTALLNVTGAGTYLWNNGIASASVAVSPTVNTTYTVVGTDANGCNNSAVHSVGLKSSPVLNLTSSSNPICIEQSATLNAAGAASYTWDTGSTLTGISITPTVTTTYTVIAQGSNGCYSSAAITQSVSACTGISQNKNNDTGFSIFPNPTNGEFTIKAGFDAGLVIANELGQVVKTVSLDSSNNNQVSVTLPKGIYFIMGSGQSGVIRYKVVVTN